METSKSSLISKVLVGAFLLLSLYRRSTKYVVNAFSGGFTWNNDNFITGAFWANNPSTGDIIDALYGSGTDTVTAYTQNWSGYTSGTCLSGGMNVVYLGDGVGMLPLTLSTGTIYVLTGTTYITTGTILPAPCSAVISNTNAILYSTGFLASMINVTGMQATIIDSLNVNGTGGGPVPAHSVNTNGIKYYHSSNNTLHNVQIYNNFAAGISYANSSNNTIDYSRIYNSDPGVFHDTCSGNIINNSQVYNNAGDGVTYKKSSDSALSNSQIYNNTSNGIHYQNAARNVLHNTQIYNNQVDGIRYETISSNDNILHSVQIYNNTLYGMRFTVSTGNVYYDSLTLFGNGAGDLAGTAGNDSVLTGGEYYSSLSWSTGQLVTGIALDWSYLTNPRDASGAYLLDRSTGFSNLIGSKSWMGDILPLSYSFGYQILLQQQPVTAASGLQLYGVPGSDYLPGKYVASSISPLSGSLTISGTITATPNIVVTFTSASATNWRLFNSVTEKSGTIAAGASITTGLILLGSGGDANVVLQLWTGSDFATHYVDTIYYHTHSATISGNLSYTNTTGIILNLVSSPEYEYSITGAIAQLYTGTLNGTTGINIYLTAGDGAKTGVVVFSTGSNVFTSTFSVILDTTAPSVPVLSFPTDMLTGVGSSFTLMWNSAVDTGIGVSGYQYILSGNGNVFTGFTTDTSVSFTGFASGGTYARQVGAFDKFLRTSAYSALSTFTIDTGKVNCTFSGMTIFHLYYATGYQNATEPVGGTCTLVSRQCNNGSFVSGAMSPSCVVLTPTPPAPSGGGSSYALSKDNCTLNSAALKNLSGANEEGIDYSSSYYDRTCLASPGTKTKKSTQDESITSLGSIEDSPYSRDLNQAYLYGYNNKLTLADTVQEAGMKNSMTRRDLAIMIAGYAMRVLGLEPDPDKKGCDKFTDTKRLDGDSQLYIMRSCQLGLMGLDTNGKALTKFRPNDLVTRAHFSAIFSRLLFGDRYDGGKPYYQKHIAGLSTHGIIKSEQNPAMKERKGYVMLMMMRADKKEVGRAKYHASAAENGSVALFSE